MKANANTLSIAVAASLVLGGCAMMIPGRSHTDFPHVAKLDPPVVSQAIDPALAGFAARWAEKFPSWALRHAASMQVDWTIDRNPHTGIITTRSAMLEVAYRLEDDRCFVQARWLLEDNLGENQWGPPRVGAGPAEDSSLRMATIDCKAVPVEGGNVASSH